MFNSVIVLVECRQTFGNNDLSVANLTPHFQENVTLLRKRHPESSLTVADARPQLLTERLRILLHAYKTAEVAGVAAVLALEY
jgi:hypothetical protein